MDISTTTTSAEDAYARPAEEETPRPGSPKITGTASTETVTQTGVTTAGLVELYLLYGESRGYRKATLDYHFTSLNHFLTFLREEVGRAQRPAREVITQTIIDHYRLYLVRKDKRNGKKLSPVTVNTYLRSLTTLVRWAVRREYLSRAPVVELVRRDRTRPKPTFSVEEFNLILSAADKEASPLLRARAKAIVLLLHDTGIRAGELCRANMKDISHYTIDGEEAHVLMIELPSKRGEPRMVAFSDTTWLAIKEYRSELARPHGRGRKHKGADPVSLFTSTKAIDEPITVAGLRRMCERLEERSGIHNNPHSYRRFFASEWMNNSEGVALDTLGEAGGWKDLRTIKEHYGRYRAATIVRAARRYSPFAR
jgi:integrase